MLSKTAQAIKNSYEKGYRVTKEGNVIGVNGNKLSLMEKQGRLSFSFRFEKERYRIEVHRLQAYQKYGEDMFKKGISVRHLNNNSLDNSYGNISIGTHSENLMDTPEVLRKLKSSSGSKYNHEKIFEDKAKGLSNGEIMNRHGIKNRSTLHGILNKSFYSKNSYVYSKDKYESLKNILL